MTTAARLAACSLVLLATGCRTLHRPVPPAFDLARDERDFAQALAYFVAGVVAEYEAGRGSDAALASYAEAARLDPGNLRLANLLAANLIHRDRAAEAVEVLARTCRQIPRSAAAHRDLAQAAEIARQFDLAERHYRKALELAPDETYAARARVRVLFRGGRDREALKALALLTRQARTDEDATAAVRWGGHFLRPPAEPARAAACFELVASHATNRFLRSEALEWSGVARQRGSETNAARAAFLQALAADPSAVSAAHRLAALEVARSGASAVTQWEQRARSKPDDAAVQLVVAALAERTRQPERALQHLAEAHRLLRRSPTLPPGMGFYLHHAARLDDAEEDTAAAEVLREGLAAYPASHPLMNHLAYLWAVNNTRLAEAEQYILAAVRDAPDNGAYIDTLAWVYYRQGRFHEALAQLTQAVRLIPDDPTIHDHLGDVLAALERGAEALGHWRRSYALDPQLPGVAGKLRHHGVDPAAIAPRQPAPTATADDELPPVERLPE